MFLLNKFCCVGLRTGNLAIGWLGLAIFVGDFIHSLCLYVSYYLGNNDSSVINSVMSTNVSYGLSSSIFGLLMNASLTYGALMAVKMMLLPWLVAVGLSIISCFSYMIYTSLEYVFENKMGLFTVFIMVGLFTLATISFLWLSVFSFYHKIKEDEVSKLKGQQPDIQKSGNKSKKPPCKSKHCEFHAKNFTLLKQHMN